MRVVEPAPAGQDWPRYARGLADQLTAAGVLADPAWQAAFAAVPRHLFVPVVEDGDRGPLADAADRAGHGGWLRAVYADQALLTQRRPVPADAAPASGLISAADGGGLPTSSSSQPSVMAVMLDRIEAVPGTRVLEIGTGTGYNTALLCHRLGAQNVTSIDIDPALAAAAADRLARLGYRPTLLAGDGGTGLPDPTCYDAVLATCAATAIPATWITQLTPGGRLVTPLGSAGGALAVLTKTAADEVTGRIDPVPAHFMPLRPDVEDPRGPRRDTHHRPSSALMSSYGTTDLDPRHLDPHTSGHADLVLWLELHLPGLALSTVTVNTDHEPDGTAATSTQTIVTDTAGATAIAEHAAATPGRWPVRQHGPRRPWDTLETACRTWTDTGRPARHRLGISALTDPHRQYIWLDDPDGPYSWPLPL